MVVKDITKQETSSRVMTIISTTTADLDYSVFQKAQKMIPFIALCIILPTVDVVTDVLLIKKLITGGYRCKHSEEDDNDIDFERCKANSVTYCTSEAANNDVCVHRNDPIYATALFLPFLLNYLVSFYTWKRICKNKMKTFIFPIINIFPQYGKNNKPKGLKVANSDQMADSYDC